MMEHHLTINKKTYVFIFGLIELTCLIGVDNVNAEKVNNITWDRLLMDEMTELGNYIDKTNEKYENNILTAIKIDSKNILSSSSLENISAELEYRGNSKVVLTFTNTIRSLINMTFDDKEKNEQNVRNLSLLYERMIQTLAVPDIDYQKLAVMIIILTIIFIMSIIMIPKIRRHYKIKF
jgi:hypothetical protein